MFLKLLCHFGPQGWWPRIWRGGNFRDEVVIGAVLTQGTLWKNVERALRRLEEAGIRDLDSLARAPDDLLHALLRPAVYVRRKVRTLRELSSLLSSVDVPDREALLKVHGVGEETADVILLYAYGVPVFVLDNYTRRWAQRFFGRRMRDRELRDLLYLGGDTYYLKEMHALLDELGKRYCGPRPDCQHCPLRRWCRHFRGGPPSSPQRRSS